MKKKNKSRLLTAKQAEALKTIAREYLDYAKLEHEAERKHGYMSSDATNWREVRRSELDRMSDMTCGKNGIIVVGRTAFRFRSMFEIIDLPIEEVEK